MKEKSVRKKDDGLELDVLIGVRRIPKPLRPLGRLGQLNKRSRRTKNFLSRSLPQLIG